MKLLRPRPVTLPQTLQHQPLQKFTRRRTVRRSERRELRFAKGQIEVAPLGDLPRVPQPVRVFLASLRHFGGCAKMKAPALPFLRMLLTQQGQRADALDDVVFLPVLGRRVTDDRAGHGGSRNPPCRWPDDKSDPETFLPAAVSAHCDQSFGEPSSSGDRNGRRCWRGNRGFPSSSRPFGKARQQPTIVITLR